MTRFDRDTMIDRYLSGTMAPSEQREFLNHVDTDAELRRQLQAERLIRNAVRADRGATAGPSATSRTQFLSMLATVTAEQQATPGPDTGPRERSALRRVFGNGYMRGTLVVIAGALLGYGGVNLLHDGDPAPATNAPAAIERTTGTPAVPAPPQSGPSRENAAPADAADPTDVVAPVPAETRAAELGTRPAAAPERPARRTETAARGSRSSGNAGEPKPSVNAASTAPRNVPVVSDSANTTVTLRPPKMKQ